MSLLECLVLLLLSVQYCISFRLTRVGDRYANIYQEQDEIERFDDNDTEKRGISQNQNARPCKDFLSSAFCTSALPYCKTHKSLLKRKCDRTCGYCVGTSTSTSTGESQIARCVRDTNWYRSKHRNTGPLQWDNYLAGEAQKYAEKLLAMSYQSDKLRLPSRGMGENLYWADNPKPATCEDANKAWYGEIKDYSYAKAGSKNRNPVGEFTQLIWKGTTKFGIGIATGKSTKYADQYGNVQTFVVAKYQKPGNFMYDGENGIYEANTENVQPLKSK